MPILGAVASGISGRLGIPSDFESIQTINIADSVTTAVSFSSIPATYKSLYLRAQFSGTSAGGEAWVSFNGDTTASKYTRQVMYNTGAGAGTSFVQASQASGRSYLYSPSSVSSYADTYPVYQNYFPDYSLTNKHKTVIQDGWQGMDNSYGAILQMAALWADTAAINQITFTMQSGAFGPKSQLALFGLK